MVRFRVLTAAAASVAAFGCPAASASVGHVDALCNKYFMCAETIVYRAAPGDQLNVKLTETPGTVTIDDQGTAPQAGAGCVVIAMHALRCTANGFAGGPNVDSLETVEVDGGDAGNTINASGVLDLAVDLKGGRGTDRMLGGGAHAATTFSPGGGTDFLDGGAGTATLSFSGLRQDVSVNLAQHIAHGLNGSLVHLQRVENVIGSDGNDTLTGDSAANMLCGGRGQNLILGNGGNDVLGSFGPARLIPGRGRSILGACGSLRSPETVATNGPASFECAGATDEVRLEDPGRSTARADWTIGSRCTRVSGLGTLSGDRPMRLRLNAVDPAHDYIFMPLDPSSNSHLPFTFHATLTARDGTLLGTVGLRTTRYLPGLALRVGRSGARYLRRHRPLTGLLRLTEQGCVGGCLMTDDRLSLRFR